VFAEDVGGARRQATGQELEHDVGDRLLTVWWLGGRWWNARWRSVPARRVATVECPVVPIDPAGRPASGAARRARCSHRLYLLIRISGLQAGRCGHVESRDMHAAASRSATSVTAWSPLRQGGSKEVWNTFTSNKSYEDAYKAPVQTRNFP
jgi:hypothetical protein